MGTVKTHLFRAKELLRRRLSADPEGPQPTAEVND
jgi:DNA-directed RNA polymerase specialized sigma24 family protein